MVAAKEIKERRLPELDDEFAKDMGEFENLQALQKAISDRLHYQAQSESAEHFRRSLEDELIKRNPVQSPPSMVEKYLQAVMEDARKRSKSPMNEEALRSAFMPVVHRNIAWILLREQLIKDQAFTFTRRNWRPVRADQRRGSRGRPVGKSCGRMRRPETVRDAMEEERCMSCCPGRPRSTSCKQPRSRFQQQHAELKNVLARQRSSSWDWCQLFIEQTGRGERAFVFSPLLNGALWSSATASTMLSLSGDRSEVFLEAEDRRRMCSCTSTVGRLWQPPGLAIFDSMQYIKPDLALSAWPGVELGALLLAAGAKGKLRVAAFADVDHLLRAALRDRRRTSRF
jgi:hypothetical protein